MKKILIAMVVIAAILITAAGCNGGDSEPMDLQAVGSTGQEERKEQEKPPETSSTPAITQPDSPVEKNLDMNALRAQVSASSGDVFSWPYSYLPQDFPAYPGGEIVFASHDDDNDLLIFIQDTNESDFAAFGAALKSAGWEFYMDVEGWEILSRGEMFVIAIYEDGETGILVCDMAGAYDWPAEQLPDGLPVYPDGDIIFLSISEDNSWVSLLIRNTDRRTVDEYITTLKAAGWTIISVEDDETSVGKGTFMISIEPEADGAVSIFVMDFGFDVVGMFNEVYEWPEIMPSYVPEYTDGSITASWSITDEGSTFYIMVEETTREALDEYLELLVEAGGDVTEADNDENPLIEMFIFSLEGGKVYMEIMASGVFAVSGIDVSIYISISA